MPEWAQERLKELKQENEPVEEIGQGMNLN